MPTFQPQRNRRPSAAQRWALLSLPVLAALALMLGIVGSMRTAVAAGTTAPAALPMLQTPVAGLDSELYRSQNNDVRHTWDVAWGDYDGDGDLDLAVANGRYSAFSRGYRLANQIYRNDLRESGSFTEINIGNPGHDSRGVAWADYDGDGDLDLAFANYGQQNEIYENVDGHFMLDLAEGYGWQSTDAGPSTSLAWGDYDGDGDLDLAFGNEGAPLQLYRNAGGALRLRWAAPPALAADTRALAWADWDGDGDLDLAVGNYDGPDQVYENDGSRLRLDPAGGDGWQAAAQAPAELADDDTCELGSRTERPDPDFAMRTRALAWGDWDGDGDPDLATAGGNDGRACGAFLKVYENEAGMLELDGDSGWQVEDKLSLSKGSSITWGDWDGDGDLDLFAGNNAGQGWGAKNRVYENVGVALRFDPARGAGWESRRLPTLNSETTHGIAVGDADGDGDLDMAVGNGGSRGGGQENFVLRNGAPAAALSPTAVSLGDGRASSSAAWGDWDGDGDLDLAVGNYGEANQVMENEAGVLFFDPENGLGWQPAVITNDLTTDVAWGDWDGDGDLDLAVGNEGQADLVYENEGGTLTLTVPADTATAGDGRLGWTSTLVSGTQSLAWGDWDRDGDLDLAAGHCGRAGEETVAEAVVVYENEGGTLQLDQEEGAAQGWLSPQVHCVRDLGWGDWDNDADLDLALAMPDGLRVYENLAGQLSFNASQNRRLQRGWEDTEVNATSLAWGDVNGDGLLDLAAGTSRANRLYYNNGERLVFDPAVSGALSDDLFNTTALSWGDVDGDKDLDLAVANAAEEGFQPNQIYENRGGVLSEQAVWQSLRAPGPAGSQQKARGLAWGDVDRDGDLDLAFANSCGGESCATGGWPNELYLNNLQGAANLVYGLPRLSIDEPYNTSSANFYASPEILASDVITLRYTLRDERAVPVGRVEVFYSLDGGDNWKPAVPVSGTQTAALETSPSGVVHEFGWDTFGSDLFGRSDNVAVRMIAYDAPLPGTEIITDTYRYYNGVAGSFQRPFVTAMSFPFRVQGTQIQVVDENGAPVEGAWVYRLPQGQTSGAGLMPDPAQPLMTDANGYLPGGGVIRPGDNLIAVQQIDTAETITFTDKVSLYHTSARPREAGLSTFLFNKAASDEIVLQVSPDNPLLLFNVDFVLEWDARNDESFLIELDAGIQRASELLYDITDGQAALGRVQVLQSKELWPYADVTVAANNALRPSAAIGGITQVPLSDTVPSSSGGSLVVPEAYVDNQIRMGTVWDPFGEYTGDLGTDWWQALAHEFAHYLFFLPDNYLGLDEGALVKINCQESFMTSTFDPTYSEFLTEEGWRDACLTSLAEATTGRFDWETIEKFYPMLQAPGENPPLEGPTTLPLDVTKVTFLAPNDVRATLRARNFEVRDAVSKERVRLPGAQAYLFQRQGTLDDPTDDVLIHLGTPTGGGDRLKVRGAYTGDRLCLFDRSGATAHAGCDDLTAQDVSIPVRETNTTWQPFIQVSPVTSRTMQITITQPITDGSPLNVQLFPAHYWSRPGESGLSPTATLSSNGDQHIGSLDLLLPAYELAVRTWVEGDDTRETIDFFRLNPPWPEPDGTVTETVLSTSISAILGPSSGGIGGPSSGGIGGPSSGGIGGPSSGGIGGPSSGGIGGPSSGGIGGPSSGGIGGPSSGGIGGPSSGGIGGPSSGGIGGPSSGGIGGPSSGGIGGTQSFNAPILSADAQVVVYSKNGFFEDNGVETLHVRSAVPQLATHPWLVPVGQAYQVALDPAVQDERIIGLTYLQRDVPEGYEHTLAVYFLPEGGDTWQRLDTDQYVENLVVADVQDVDGTYAVMSTVSLPPLTQGRNLFTYPLPVPQAADPALASLGDRVAGVFEVTQDGGVGQAATRFEFGRGYWIDISDGEPVVPYLKPPVRLPDGSLGFN